MDELGEARILSRAAREHAADRRRSRRRGARGARAWTSCSRRRVRFFVVVAGSVERRVDLLRTIEQRRGGRFRSRASHRLGRSGRDQQAVEPRPREPRTLYAVERRAPETVRIAGIASTGTHGTGKQTATVRRSRRGYSKSSTRPATFCVLSEETVGVVRS